MSEKTVEIDGIHYLTLLEGPAARNVPPVLLCHALMSNLHMYDDTVKALNDAGYNTPRFDHIGHGRTPSPEDETATYHMDDITRHMYQIVEAVTGQTKLKAFVGCSIGGVIALRYGMLFPHDVERIVSVAAPGIATPAIAKGPEGLWAKRIESFEQDGGDELCRLTVQRWFPGNKAIDRQARERALPMNKTCTLKGYKVLADAIRGYDYSDELGKIVGGTTLVVHGSEDGAADPEHLKNVAERVGGTFAVMDGAGHLPPLHQPDEFNDLVLKHLR